MGYGEEFKDAGDGKTSLSQGIFEWLVSIRPSHLVYMSGDTCYLEPYVPSQFARKLGLTNFMLVIRTLAWPSWGALLTVLAPGGSSSLAILRHGCACRWDPKPTNDFGVLSVV